jgi:glucose-6-phosphate dehydrogenase assembly protein OpcA
MIVDLPSTTTSAVNKKMVELRERGGAVALGRVLTLVIVTDDGGPTEDAIDAANDASREHPCRVIVLARGARRAAARLDAQIRVGGDAGASEVIVMRMYGPLADQGASVTVPLLLPDATPRWPATRSRRWPSGGPPTPTATPTWRGRG